MKLSYLLTTQISFCSHKDLNSLKNILNQEIDKLSPISFLLKKRRLISCILNTILIKGPTSIY